MADVAVASQLQHWAFEKRSRATRPERSGSDSSASSPNLCDDSAETLRIDTESPERPTPAARKESVVLQERYMSSEEDLSPADDASDSEYDYEDAVVHDAAKARTMSISRWDKGRSCDMAVTISYAWVGRPKVVELQSPVEAPVLQQRSASLAGLPDFPIGQLRKADAAQRMSMKVPPTSSLSSATTSRSATPQTEPERRPSTSHSPSTKASSTLHHANSASATSSFRTAPSSRSVSPAVDDILARPLTAAADAPSARSSVYIPSQSRNRLSKVQTTQSSFRHSQWAPLTPASPAAHAFLQSDPYENTNTHSASPIIKSSAPHKRLRSISMKLALAKIAITSPSRKTYEGAQALPARTSCGERQPSFGQNPAMVRQQEGRRQRLHLACHISLKIACPRCKLVARTRSSRLSSSHPVLQTQMKIPWPVSRPGDSRSGNRSCR
jgi:hypothetical protein